MRVYKNTTKLRLYLQYSRRDSQRDDEKTGAVFFLVAILLLGYTAFPTYAANYSTQLFEFGYRNTEYEYCFVFSIHVTIRCKT